MRFAIFFVVAILILSMAFTFKVDEYKIDSKKSKLTWVGKKVTGEHTGNISISNGKFVVDGKKVTGGSFEIDMTSITNSDMKPEYGEKLVGHLKSDDFFSTSKYPKSKFEITSITSSGNDQYAVTGNLTIKDITKEVKFPATIQILKNLITAKAAIIVNRTDFGIKYGSANFFENLGDKSINDEFELKIELVGKK